MRLERTLGCSILLLFCLAGCGSEDNGRVPVKGSVTFEGEVVQYGAISLRPSRGANGLAAGAEIRKGTYEIPQKVGPSIGQYSARFTIVSKGTEQSRLGGDMQTIEVPIEIAADKEEYNFELTKRAKP